MSSGLATPPQIQQSTSVVAAPNPSEGFIDQRLRQTRRRVKMVDIFTGLVVLTIGVLAYLLVVALIDHWMVVGGLATWGRFLLWLALVVAAGAYFVVRVLPPLLNRINPIFAAATIEKSQPALKNGLINFLLLRGRRQEVAASFYRAMESRAASDLSKVEIDVAVDRTHLVRLACVLLVIVTSFCLYLVISPKNPLRSAARVLFPWSTIEAPTRVTIRDVRPGTRTCFHGESITVSANVDGLRDGEPIRLIYNTSDAQIVDQEIPMTKTENGLRYECRFPPGSLGFQQDCEYYLTGGDCQTPRYRIIVQTAPIITIDSVDYSYPTYTGIAKKTVQKQGDLRAIEGTEVTIHATANTEIEPNSAEIDLGCTGRVNVRMTVEGRTATGHFTLRTHPDDSSRPNYDCYRLRFTDLEGRENPQAIRYSIDVIRDMPPEVELLEPAQAEAQVAENGKLAIKVRAQDQDALRRVSVRAEQDGRSLSLAPLLERRSTEKPFTGEFVGTCSFEPAKLGLKAGDRIPYFAEAEDNKEPVHNRTATEKRWIVVVAADKQGTPEQNPDAAKNDQPQPNDDNQARLNDKDQAKGDAGKSNDSKTAPDDANVPDMNNNQGNAKDDPAKDGADQPQQPDQPQDKPNKKIDDKTDPAAAIREILKDQKQQQENQEDQEHKNPQGQNDQKQPGGAQQDDKQKGAGGQSDQKQPGGAQQDDKQKGAGGQSDQKQPGGAQQDDKQKGAGDQSDQKQPGGAQQDDKQKGAGGQSDQKQPGGAQQDDKQKGAGGQSDQKQPGGAQQDDKQKGAGGQSDQKQPGGAQQDDKQKGAGDQSDQKQPGGAQQDDKQKGAGGQSDQKQPGGAQQDDKQKGAGGQSDQKQPGGAQQDDKQKGAGGQSDQKQPGGAQQDDKQKGAGDQSDQKQPGGAQQDDKQKGAGGQSDQKQPGGAQQDDKQKGAGGQSDQTQPDSTPQDDKQKGAGGQSDPKQPGGAQQDDKQKGAGGQSDQKQPGGAQQDDKQKGAGGQSDQKQPGGAQQDDKQKGAGGQSDQKQPDGAQQDDKQKGAGGQSDQKQPDGAQQDDKQKGAGGQSDQTQPDSTQQDDKQKGAGGQSDPKQPGGAQQDDKQGTGPAGSQNTKDQANSKAKNPVAGKDGNQPGDKADAKDAANTDKPGASGPGGKDGEKTTTPPDDSQPQSTRPGDDDKSGTTPKNPPNGGTPGKGSSSDGTKAPGSATDGNAPAKNDKVNKPAEPNDTPADKANPEYARQQTELALEHLRDQLAKEKPALLDRLGWTKDEAQQFLNRWEAMKRAAAENGPQGDAARKKLADAIENLNLHPHGAALQRGGVTPDKPQNLRDRGRFPAPPDWDEQFRAYTRGISNGNRQDKQERE